MVIMLPGDIILVRGMDVHRVHRQWFRFLVSWIISKLTKSEYTHSAIFDGYYMIDVDIGQKVGFRHIAEYQFYDAYRVKGTTMEDRREAVLFALSQFGKGYSEIVKIGKSLLKVPQQRSLFYLRSWSVWIG